MEQQITERSINMKIIEKTPETILARGSILDQVHNITIELEISELLAMSTYCKGMVICSVCHREK